jgi:P-type Ca2+ transporter type 2C
VFTGVGYSQKSGNLVITDAGGNQSRALTKRCQEFPALEALFHTGCLCNNAALSEAVDGQMIDGCTGAAISGQPTEIAILVSAAKARIEDIRPQYHRVQEVPFNSDRKRMEVRARPVNGVHACEAFRVAVTQPQNIVTSLNASDGSIYFVKGMPEKVLGECDSYCRANGSTHPLSEGDRVFTLTQSRRMAATGLRVIAFAYGQSLEKLTFAGLMGMEDPPREGVADCIMNLRRGGVNVMMVTGDSKETALAIAQRCGILGPITSSKEGELCDLLLSSNSEHGLDDSSANDDFRELEEIEFGVSSKSLSGSDIDSITPANLSASISGVNVFYRVSPRHKLTIVRARKYEKYLLFLRAFLHLY